MVVLIAVVSAWPAARWHTEFFRTHTRVWATLVFLLGPVGLLAYRLHFRPPVVEQCSGCGLPSPRDRESCAACGVDFPTPEMLGNEVFA